MTPSATPTLRTVLAQLAKSELLDVGRRLEVAVTAKTPHEEMLDAFVASERASLEAVLPALTRDTLKDLCKAFALPLDGRDKAAFVDRLLVAASCEVE
jgi:hypothetical protein